MAGSVEPKRRGSAWRRLPRAVRRFLRFLGALLVLLLVLYAVAPVLIVPTVVRRVALPMLEEAFGAPVHVEKISAGYFGDVTLTNVSVADVEGGRPMVEAARIDARLDLLSLFRRHYHLHHVTADRFLLRVTVHADGTTNFDRALVGFGIIRAPEHEIPSVRISRLEFVRSRAIIRHPVGPPPVEIADGHVLGWVDGVTFQSSLTATATAFDGRLRLRGGIRGASPDLGPDTVRMHCAWEPGADTERPLSFGPLEGFTAGRLVLDLGPGSRAALRGRAELSRGRITPAWDSLPAIRADRIDVRPDLVVDLNAAGASLRGGIDVVWREADVDSRRGVSALGLGGGRRFLPAGAGKGDRHLTTVRSQSPFPDVARARTTGRAAVQFSGGKPTSLAFHGSFQDLRLQWGPVRSAGSARLTVPGARVGLDLEAEPGGRPTGVLDVRLDGVSLAEAMSAIGHAVRAGDRPRPRLGKEAGDPFPFSARGLVDYTGHLVLDGDGRLWAEGSGRIVRFVAGSGEDAKPAGQDRTGTVRLDHSLALAADEGSVRLVDGVVNWRVADVGAGPVLLEVDRVLSRAGTRGPGAGPRGVLGDLSGRVDGAGRVDLNRRGADRAVSVKGSVSVRDPSVGGRPLCLEVGRVDGRFDLDVPIGARARGSVSVAARRVDVKTLLTALGLDDAARRLDGDVDVDGRVGVLGRRPMRVEGDLFGRDVSVATDGGRLVLGEVHLSPRLLVDYPRRRMDVEETSVSAWGLNGRLTGWTERAASGRWTGGLNARVNVDASTLLTDLRRAGAGVPSGVSAVGEVPLDVSLTLEARRLRAEGGATLGEGATIRVGRVARIPRGAKGDLRFVLEHVPGENVLTIRRLSCALPGVTVQAAGRVDLSGPTTDVAVGVEVSDVAQARSLSPLVSDVDLAGRLQATARVTGPAARPRVAGTLRTDDLSIALGRDTGDRLRVAGGLSFEGPEPGVVNRRASSDERTPAPRDDWKASTDRVTVAWRGSEVEIAGTGGLRTDGRPTAALRLVGTRFRIDDLAGGSAGDGEADWMRRLRRAEVDIDTTIDQFDLGFLTLEKVTGTLRLKDGRLWFDPAVGLLGGGGVAGDGVVDLNDTAPVLRLNVRAIGIRQEGKVAEFVKENADLLWVIGTSDLQARLAIPLVPDPARPWPTGVLRVVCHDGKLESATSPDWLPRLFRGLRLDRYPFRLAAARVVLEGGDRIRITAFFESEVVADIVADIGLTHAGTRQVTVVVDLESSVTPRPALFTDERPYAVTIYESQEAWMGGERVLRAGGFRSVTDVSYDLVVRRSALTQVLLNAGGELGRFGLRALDRIVPLRAIDELLGGTRRPSR